MAQGHSASDENLYVNPKVLSGKLANSCILTLIRSTFQSLRINNFPNYPTYIIQYVIHQLHHYLRLHVFGSSIRRSAFCGPIRRCTFVKPCLRSCHTLALHLEAVIIYCRMRKTFTKWFKSKCLIMLLM